MGVGGVAAAPDLGELVNIQVSLEGRVVVVEKKVAQTGCECGHVEDDESVACIVPTHDPLVHFVDHVF